MAFLSDGGSWARLDLSARTCAARTLGGVLQPGDARLGLQEQRELVFTLRQALPLLPVPGDVVGHGAAARNQVGLGVLCVACSLYIFTQSVPWQKE